MADIKKARHISRKELKTDLSKALEKDDFLVVTKRGVPKNVIFPYSEMIELIEIIDELGDAELLETIKEGREAIKSGAKGIPVSSIFEKIRTNR